MMKMPVNLLQTIFAKHQKKKLEWGNPKEKVIKSTILQFNRQL